MEGQEKLFGSNGDKSNDDINWKPEHILYFQNIPHLGRVTIHKLIQEFPDINAWDYNKAVNLVDKRSVQYIPKSIPVLDDLNDENIITFFDKEYPNNLKGMGVDKPLMLWYKGNLNIDKSIAVIGSRNIHPETIPVTEQFTEIAINNGFNIVSGLALGTDTIGHKTAVNNGAKTTVILPGPIDNVTPRENRALVDKILENDGLLLTEYKPKSQIERKNFVERDRLQAGLSNATFVGQTGIPGGTLHTVRYTIKYERKLIVYKPSSTGTQYAGNLKLINAIDPKENFDFLNIREKISKENLRKKEMLADFVVNDTESMNNAIQIINSKNDR